MSVRLKQKGDFLLNQGKTSEAIQSYQQAIQQKPDYAEAYNNLGIAFKYQNRLAEAERLYLEALRLEPDFAEVSNNLGNVLMEQGQLDKAILQIQKALQVKPDYAEAHNNLGNAFQEQKDFTVAIHCYQRAIKLNPQYHKAFNNLGNAYQKLGLLNQAILCYQKAIELRPDYSEAFNNAGNALVESAKIPEAIAAYKKALDIDPAYIVAHSNLLLAWQYQADFDIATHYVAAKNWWQQQASNSVRPDITRNPATGQKRLKIGYISSDFRQHSVSFFFLPLLTNHDRSLVEVFCYSGVKFPDYLTHKIRMLCDHWRPIVGRSDHAIADQVRQDGIDILVDLAGHTAENRLPVFAHKPAPVQVTWLGYPGTTGMPVIDYRITDDIADPPGEADEYHSETLIRLPLGFLCYGPPVDAPDVSGLPARKNGLITFGSFNNLPKINPEVVALWSRLLDQVTDSRLLLKSKQFTDKYVRQQFLDLFSAGGIGAERLTLLPRAATTAAHLALYHQVDIALDPFPYNGTTTTCEALWMGVPVITLRGERHAGRVGASLLNKIGLGEMVAENQDQYAGIGIELAEDMNALENLRAGLRSHMQSSALCDGRAFARTMEYAFQKAWRNLCQKNNQRN